MVNKKRKILDIIIITLFAASIAVSIIYAGYRRTGSPYLVIDAPSGQFVYPLNKDRIIKVTGKIGVSEIKIEEGTAQFISSPCKNKICIKTGKLKKDSDWAACLPNRIFIRVEGSDKKGTKDFNTLLKKGRIKDMNSRNLGTTDAVTN